jgi:hypothetical protein
LDHIAEVPTRELLLQAIGQGGLAGVILMLTCSRTHAAAKNSIYSRGYRRVRSILILAFASGLGDTVQAAHNQAARDAIATPNTMASRSTVDRHCPAGPRDQERACGRQRAPNVLCNLCWSIPASGIFVLGLTLYRYSQGG